MSAAAVGRNQRSSSICLSGSQTFDAMKASVGGNNRESSSGSDSPEVRREVITSNYGSSGGGRPVPSGSSKTRQNARRSKSERLQGANKPRVKRRDLALDLDRANSGSLAGGLTGNKEQDDPYQSFLRKVPSVGAGLMNDSSFNDTPDGSPRGLRSLRQSAGNSKPPLGVSSNVPAISTPDLSPSLIRRATVNSAGVQRAIGASGSRSQLANRNSPQVGRPGGNSTSANKDQSLNKRANSVRAHGASNSSSFSAFHVTNSSLRRSTYLDVPDSPGNDEDNATGNVDEDSYRLRSFDLTRKGFDPSFFLFIHLSLSPLPSTCMTENWIVCHSTGRFDGRWPPGTRSPQGKQSPAQGLLLDRRKSFLQHGSPRVCLPISS
jgi:hypothetical protein